MARPLSVGDKVLCRLYNTPDKHYQGGAWVGTITDIYQPKTGDAWWMLKGKYLYEVTDRTGGQVVITLRRKEILRRYDKIGG